MDQHPIPQDVTGFQFKLIGSMTVKQFGYIALGVIMATILYYIPAQTSYLIITKVILVPLFGLSGIIIAFVPIEGRPVDVMANHFFKALFSPNQYAYKRAGRKLSFSSISATRMQGKEATDKKSGHAKEAKALNQKEVQLQAFLNSEHKTAKNDLDRRETAFLGTIATIDAPVQAQTPPSPIAGLHTPPYSPEQMKDALLKKMAMPNTPTPFTAPAPTVTSQAFVAQPNMTPPASMSAAQTTQPEQADPKATDAALTQKELLLAQQLTQAKQEETTQIQEPAHAEAHEKTLTLEHQLQEVHAQKQQLEQELIKLQSQLSAHQEQTTPVQQPIAQPLPSTREDTQHVRTVPQGITKSVGLPHVPDTANVVVGIVKDPRGNVLPNILVEVKDKDGNPVRAFKTNPLGQFASATALAIGTYTIELDDPKKLHTFDLIQITANNEIMQPIEVVSHDAREELRKQLFN